MTLQQTFIMSRFLFTSELFKQNIKVTIKYHVSFFSQRVSGQDEPNPAI